MITQTASARIAAYAAFIQREAKTALQDAHDVLGDEHPITIMLARHYTETLAIDAAPVTQTDSGPAPVQRDMFAPTQSGLV